MIEQVLYVTRVSSINNWPPEFSRLYYGNEFCERLLPTLHELESAIQLTGEKKLHFTLVTPYVTDKGLESLTGLLDYIIANKVEAEVVFNDWGVFRMLREHYPQLVPVMGRLLNKMKRGPRLMMVIDKLPESTVEYFRNSSFSTPLMQKYLNDHGVYRVELDNLLQGIDLPIPNLAVSLYIPYAYVTTTRLCLLANSEDLEKDEVVGIYPCKKECRKYTLGLANEIMPVLLIRKGNTIFFENPALPEDMETAGISRLVIQPEIPM